MIIDSNNNIWACGSNYSGNLGVGSTDDEEFPLQVSSLGNVTEISVGYNHTLALDSFGNLYAWGYNNFGALGNGTIIDEIEPILINISCSTNQIEESNSTNIIAYPNPLNNILFIESNEILDVSIFDEIGKLILSRTIFYEDKINFTDFSKGVYYMKTSKNAKVLKLIKS